MTSKAPPAPDVANKRQFDTPTAADALVVARAPRIAGDLRARQLAEYIERACRFPFLALR
jgi:hypothetical protein